MEARIRKRIALSALLLLALLAACKGPAEPAVVAFDISQTPTPAAPPTPTPTPRVDALNAAPGVYTLAWLSDTQHYSENYPETFYEMTRFLADPLEQKRLNLKYAIFTGDFVDVPDDVTQWEVASRAMSALDDTLPYGVLGGNHDVDQLGGIGWRYYSLYFGAARFQNKPWYGGENFRDNRGHYDLFDIGNTKYLFLYISYEVHDVAVDWVNDVLARYPDRVCFLMTHQYFDENGKYYGDGERIRDEILPNHDNVYMILFGHRYDSVVVPLKVSGPNGERTVLHCMTNYQAAGQAGGGGYMRFIQIDEAAGTMRMLNYSPVLDDFTYYDEPAHQAEKYAFDPADEDVTVDIPWL